MGIWDIIANHGHMFGDWTPINDNDCWIPIKWLTNHEFVNYIYVWLSRHKASISYAKVPIHGSSLLSYITIYQDISPYLTQIWNHGDMSLIPNHHFMLKIEIWCLTMGLTAKKNPSATPRNLLASEGQLVADIELVSAMRLPKTAGFCLCQWPFQEPKLEVPTLYEVYTPRIWPYTVQNLTFRILEFPLTLIALINIEHW